MGKLELVGQKLPSIAARLIDHSGEEFASEVKRAVVAEVLGHDNGRPSNEEDGRDFVWSGTEQRKRRGQKVSIPCAGCLWRGRRLL